MTLIVVQGERKYLRLHNIFYLIKKSFQNHVEDRKRNICDLASDSAAA